jgi:hypothetical protein
MNGSRVVAGLTALIAFALAGISVLVRQTLGFPDGHLTDYERALRTIYAVFSAGSMLAGGLFVILMLRATRPRSLVLAWVGYLAFGLLLVLLAFLFGTLLDNGGGA